ncbi:nucleotidyltransferase domain-containing protein [Kineosporia corallincola]
MDEVIEEAADRLATLPGVEAVTLGGSRAQGTARPDSDWDLGVYYQDGFDPRHINDLGYEGRVFGLGEWGGGVFDSGAWLRVDGRSVDVHYRNLGAVTNEVARAERGEFDIEPLMFHLAGIPTYLVVAELAVNRLLRGTAPVVGAYPRQLRRKAARVWADRAAMHLAYAENNQQRTMQCLGLIAVAVAEYAHAVVASEGIWVTNEKRLTKQAKMVDVDELVRTSTSTGQLIRAVRELSPVQAVSA